jgi:DNA-binding transcriptional regulator YiaG
MIRKSTSAGSSMRTADRDFVVVQCLLSNRGTVVPMQHVMAVSLPQTSSGVQAIPDGPAIMELRRLTALTWEQLAKLFGVSRRALHHWASGAVMAPTNKDHLERLVATVKRIDKGSSNATRDALLQEPNGKLSAFTLLCNRKYAEAELQLGRGPGREQLILKPLSQAAQDARRPPTPADLVGARQDTVHVEVGRSRKAKSVRVRSER